MTPVTTNLQTARICHLRTELQDKDQLIERFISIAAQAKHISYIQNSSLLIQIALLPSIMAGLGLSGHSSLADFSTYQYCLSGETLKPKSVTVPLNHSWPQKHRSPTTFPLNRDRKLIWRSQWECPQPKAPLQYYPGPKCLTVAGGGNQLKRNVLHLLFKPSLIASLP